MVRSGRDGDEDGMRKPRRPGKNELGSNFLQGIEEKKEEDGCKWKKKKKKRKKMVRSSRGPAVFKVVGFRTGIAISVCTCR
jgi:hypothetical protein